MPFIVVEETGIDGVITWIESLQGNLHDLTPFWRNVFGPFYFTAIQSMFAGGGGVEGAGVSNDAWAPLSPQYAAWKAKKYPGQPIMVREGNLRASLTWVGGGLGPGGIFVPGPDGVIVGTSIPYASFHQTGTSKMPARPVLPAPDMDFYAPLLADWLMSGGETPGQLPP